MQVMTRISALVVLFCLGLSLSATADGADRVRQAMDAMRQGEWAAALTAAGPDGSVENDLIEWHRLRAGRGTPAQVVDFLQRRPDWPGLDWLRRKSEAVFDEASTKQILAFFAEQPPQTPEGVLVHAKALIAQSREGDAFSGVVLAWHTMPMGSGLQASYLKSYKKLLAPHHVARLDRMLWDAQMVSAKRMLPLVDDANRALAEARIALHDMAPGVDTKIEAVPESLRGDPGLAFGRFVWRDRKGRDEDAIVLLLERSTSAAAMGEPEKWAARRRDLARLEMRIGDPARAYRIASQHYLTEGAGYAFSDLEWLSGFLALRKLNDPSTALKHFQRFDASVASPISKGRAGYWLGRAHEALGEAEAAQEAYAMGAGFQTSFYGLLAAERIGRPFDRALAKPAPPPPWRESEIMKSSVLKAALLFLAADEPALAERFLTHMVETLDPVAANQVGAMVLDMDRPHLAVMIAKRAARTAMVLPDAYYPIHPVAGLKLPMAQEMTLAIARRESEFDPVVISGAGARGLMQVMPATAKLVARDLGILAGHDTGRLTSEWQYNAKLGANYLAGLAGDFNGNVVMMSAGYNAGPGRPTGWMERYGDPRTGDPDIVDWIEHIPFNETRNYVMRVTESLPIYRARLGKEALPIPFSRELTGSTLRAFAP
ncbi:MAG: soluble lytic murein transglycosylase [Paracoccaceae bacterium]|jgi:soluble lytic murein transglycosylase